VVRRWLPTSRYRGPSVLLLLLLAGIAAIGVGFFFPNDALVLTTGIGQLYAARIPGAADRDPDLAADRCRPVGLLAEGTGRRTSHWA